jgi:hypothetical protein
MATGRLGTADLTGGAAEVVYTVPADTFSVVAVNVCNRSGSAVTINIALASADTATTDEYIEFGADLVANGVLERTGLVLETGTRVIVTSSGSSVSAVCMGIETQTA